MSARPLPAALAALLLAAGAASQETVEVQVSRGGFRPGVLNARAGETLRLKLTSSDGEHCFALDALRVEKRVVPGRTTLLDLTPDRVGRFPFHCCLEGADSTERGTLVVGE